MGPRLPVIWLIMNFVQAVEASRNMINVRSESLSFGPYYGRIKDGLYNIGSTTYEGIHFTFLCGDKEVHMPLTFDDVMSDWGLEPTISDLAVLANQLINLNTKIADRDPMIDKLCAGVISLNTRLGGQNGQ